MLTLVYICGGITFLILFAMAAIFWVNPDQGLQQTTHRREMLPKVMADRYTAFAILALGALVYGDLYVLAVFFAVCAFIGFADGWLYRRAGHPHVKHTASGILSAGAFAITLIALMTS